MDIFDYLCNCNPKGEQSLFEITKRYARLESET